MAEIIISEKQLGKITDSINFQKDFELAQQNWDKFSNKEKDGIVECLKQFYPANAKLIKEASWYNTLGDIVGIFDPTGVVDLVNGISYIRQGDNLFGFLSLISAVPYIGDVVAKPMMGALKIGAPPAKTVSKAMKLVQANKSKEGLELLEKATQQGGITGKFVNGFSKVAGKLRGYIERAPDSIFGGLKRTIFQWFDLFEKAAKSGTVARQVGANLAKNMKTMTPEQQVAKLEAFKSALAATKGPFTGYRTSKGIISWKTLFRGTPQLIGRNASVRALMRQTKWWAGFLDYIGIANFVGPEEISKKMGEAEFMKKMEEYQKTPEARQNFVSDFGEDTGDSQTQSTTTQPSAQTSNSSQDPFANFLNKLFKDAINPLP